MEKKKAPVQKKGLSIGNPLPLQKMPYEEKKPAKPVKY
jgi:hypothetical protein